MKCTPCKKKVGRATWRFIFANAVCFPAKADMHRRKTQAAIINSLSLTYPCCDCKKDFMMFTKKRVPLFETQESFIEWAIDLHEEVCFKLQKRPSEEYYDEYGNILISCNDLGTYTWDLLFLYGNVFPDKPDATEIKTIYDFLVALAEGYPCGKCQPDLELFVYKYPPMFHSKTDFIDWIENLYENVLEKKPVDK